MTGLHAETSSAWDGAVLVFADRLPGTRALRTVTILNDYLNIKPIGMNPAGL